VQNTNQGAAVIAKPLRLEILAYPPVFEAPVRRVSVGILPYRLEKLEW